MGGGGGRANSFHFLKWGVVVGWGGGGEKDYPVLMGGGHTKFQIFPFCSPPPPPAVITDGSLKSIPTRRLITTPTGRWRSWSPVKSAVGGLFYGRSHQYRIVGIALKVIQHAA